MCSRQQCALKDRYLVILRFSVAYEFFRLRYAQILAVYENHDPIDFEQVKLLLPGEYKLTGPERFFIRLRYCLNFWTYAILMIALVTCLWFAFVG